MNEIIEAPARGIVQSAGRMSVAEVTQHVIAVQEVMRAVMKENVHYGVIPFTDKPTLYKAGAEVLCMTFRIADEYQVTDLSTQDAIRYRVTCIGKHQLSGVELGSGMGEGSTAEEKYRWRKAVCKEEYEATPATMRRHKYGKSKGGGHYIVEQVRTEPADIANTVLKMACKRAKMAMVLNVTAASDCFTQDLDDLDDTLRESLSENAKEANFDATRAQWLEAVAACKTPEELAVLAKAKGPAVSAFQATRDAEGYAQFVKAVKARGAELKPKTEAPPTDDAPELGSEG